MTTVTKTRPRRKAKRRPATRPAAKSTVCSTVLRFRSDFGLTRNLLARMTGLSERTLASWEAGKPVGTPTLRAVTAAERLLSALSEVVRPGGVVSWLQEPNDAFSGLKPVEVIERGEADRLWRVIYFLGSGTVS